MAGKALPALYVHSVDYRDLRLYLASSERGAVRVCLRLDCYHDPKGFFAEMYPERTIIVSKSQNATLLDAVQSALRGKPMTGRLPLDISVTPFQWNAYQTISRIPYGHTWTYGEVARAMGRRGAARAVGQAMGANPLPIIFP